jgi:hypothetical protein
MNRPYDKPIDNIFIVQCSKSMYDRVVEVKARKMIIMLTDAEASTYIDFVCSLMKAIVVYASRRSA